MGGLTSNSEESTEKPTPIQTPPLSRQMKPNAPSALLTRLAKSWTYDPIHPQYQFQTFLTSLAKHPKLTDESVAAVQALKDNVAQKKWPPSTFLTKPASMPHYYDRLMDGVEKSSRGIGRPWWKVFFNIW